MKVCAHCKTENQDETIFCQHCRRPLGAARTPSPTLLFGLLMVLVLIALSFYLFSSRPFPTPAATHHLTTTVMTAAGWVYMLSDDHQTGWVDASLLGDAGDLRRVLLEVHFNAECLPCGTLSL